ncbi:hypothetical protein HMI55_000134 [Coelomomyces lativittatus]|nr:hypothetical protein HMI55_000134 [Coelomomyces lativittatus]
MSTQQSTSAPTSPGSFPLHPATLSDVNSTSLHSMTEEATSTTSPPSDLVIVDKIHHVDIHVSKNNELMHMMKLLTELFYPSLSFSSTTTTSTSPFSLDPLSTTSSLNAEWPLPESSDHFVHHQVPLIHQLTSQFLKTFPNAFLDVWHYLKPFIEFLHEHVHGHLTLKLPPPRASMHPTPPLPPLRPSAPYHHFGETWVDPYGGYEDRADPEVMKYMEQEQKYTETCLAPIQPLTQQVYQELMARMHASDASYTFEYHGFSYSSRKIKGKEYLLHGRQPIHPDGSLGVWEVYLDENKLATELEQNKETHEEIEAKEEKETKEDNKTDSMVHYFHLMFLKHHTNTWVAYGVDRVGHDQGTIYICQFPNSKSPLSTPSVTEGEEPFFDASLSVTTPLIVHETLHDAGDCFEFDPSGKFGFYVTMDTSYRSCRVYCHELDTPQSQDVLVYDEKDPAVCVTLKRAPNLSCLWILAITQTSSEVYALSFPYAPLTTTPRVLYPRQLNVIYTVQMHDDQTLYVCTNEQGKWNNWIFRAPWHSLHARQVVLEHRDFVMIEAFQLHQSYLAVFERSNGLQHIRVMHAQALEQYHYISFPESVYAIWPLTPTEDIYGIVSETHYATSELLLCYTSLITPKQWILYNMQSKMLRTVYQDTILGPLYVPHHSSV